MSIFDYLFLFFLMTVVLRGAQAGFLSAFIGLFGWFFGLYFATHYYDLLTPYLGDSKHFLYPWFHQAVFLFAWLFVVWCCKFLLRQILVGTRSGWSRLFGSLVNFCKAVLLASLLLAPAKVHLSDADWWKDSLFIELLEEMQNYFPSGWEFEMKKLWNGEALNLTGDIT